MAMNAEVHARLGVEPEQARRLRAVGVVTARAIEGLFGPGGVLPLDGDLLQLLAFIDAHCFGRCQGMAGRRKARHGMRQFGGLLMAIEAYCIRAFHQQGHLIGRMGAVAGQARAACNGGVHGLLRKGLLVVAGKAEARRLGLQELRVLRRMRVVAAGASHASGRPDVRPLAILFVFLCGTLTASMPPWQAAQPMSRAAWTTFSALSFAWHFRQSISCAKEKETGSIKSRNNVSVLGIETSERFL